MQKRILYFLTITLLFFGANFFISNSLSQVKPFTIGQILRAVASLNDAASNRKRIISNKIISDIRQRQVEFQLTRENEKLLRDEGATDDIIEAIRQNSPRLQTPTQSPSISKSPKEIKNSIGMEFVKIPAGSFMIGSPANEEGSVDDERPQHRVTISRDFYMGKYEVTQGQWKALMGNNPSYFSKCGDDCPVEQVSWDDAQDFIRKLNAKDSETYRLPTEAEWEYAARAGTTTPFGIRNGNNLSSNEANFDGEYPYGNSAKGVNLLKTVSVGSYSPNGWGLYDMHGNVWEWCADWYGSYSSSAQTDPTGVDSGSKRVLRGGSFYRKAEIARAAFRFFSESSFRNFGTGFRIVRE